MSAQQKPAERDSVGKALARTANPAHAASLLRRAFACLRTRGYEGSLRMHATLRGRTCLKLRLVMPKGRREGQP